MADYLFIYGTLHPDHAPSEIADVARAMKPIGKGSLRGTRYELGDYPAVKLGSRAAGTVHGEVFILPSDPQALARLDEYEDYRPDDPENSLYKRKRVSVTLRDGSVVRSWIYVYNQPLPRNAIKGHRPAQPISRGRSKKVA